jgi:cyclase
LGAETQARLTLCLLLHGNVLVKTKKFKDVVYVDDPLNAVRIFKDKQVGEIFILDIKVSREKHEPDYE